MDGGMREVGIHITQGVARSTLITHGASRTQSWLFLAVGLGSLITSPPSALGCRYRKRNGMTLCSQAEIIFSCLQIQAWKERTATGRYVTAHARYVAVPSLMSMSFLLPTLSSSLFIL